MNGFAVIQGLSTVKAENTMKQTECALLCKQKLVEEIQHQNEKEKIQKEKFIEAVYQNTCISERHLVTRPDGIYNTDIIEDYTKNPYENDNETTKLEKRDSAVDLNSSNVDNKEFKDINQLQLDERFNIFEYYSKQLVIEASNKALADANVDPSAIGEVIFVTNTGFHAPNLQQPFFEEVGVSHDAILTNLMGMGCGGGIAGLRTAFEHCKADKELIVLLCVVDISSVHTTYKDTKLDVILHGIFGDGCAATVMQYSEEAVPGKLCIDGQFSKFVAGTRDGIDVSFDSQSVKCTLSKNLPNYIRQGLGET
eukprot:Pgem_evm2s4130